MSDIVQPLNDRAKMNKNGRLKSVKNATCEHDRIKKLCLKLAVEILEREKENYERK